MTKATAIPKQNVASGRLYSRLLKPSQTHLRQAEQQEESDDIFGR
jgi:hypothetical protein